MTQVNDALAQQCIRAIRTSADILGTDPLALARRLEGGQIARLAQLLNAAQREVSSPGLRHRIEDVLSEVTDGQMPMFVSAETDLDDAMKTLRRRREQRDPGPADEELQG